MSNLSSVEKRILENFLGMKSGYVLDFSNRTFEEFIFENTNINIYEDKYNYESGSKANRLRAFWKQESNYNVGKLIAALLEHWKAQNLINNSAISPSDKDLFDECFQISQRLVKEGNNDENIDQVAINAYFEEIQINIIEQIESAKFTIWVAVAWFTDKVLFEHLVTKNNQGVNVQLMIIDDEINQNSGLKYEEKFEIYRVLKAGKYENMMHNKFCVIDLKTVIHGSYNWTRRARFNCETIVVENSRENAEKFAEQFIRLKRTAALAKRCCEAQIASTN
jgi:phosphatidylserine/phosphatidylglycerophosphate/cardiolipin synthase-like enzyme